MQTIDSVENLDFDKFHNTYYRKKPVIVKGGITDSRFFKLWSWDYLKKKMGNRPVTFEHTSLGIFNDAVTKVETLKGPFNRMIDKFRAKEGEDNTYYLAQSSVNDNYPELLEDLEQPKFIKESDFLSAINLWIGGKGCDSGLHYDFSDNFFLQVRGSKDLALFSPEDSKYLYPSKKVEVHHMSEIKFYEVDHDKFPLFEKAQQFKVMVEEGDSVYIPPYWWHNLLTLETSISVNYWWTKFDVPTAGRAKLVSTDKVYNLIEGFLGMGYTIEHVAEDHELVMHTAIKNGFDNILEALLKHGADPNSKSLKINPGVSALQMAVEFNRPSQVRILLNYGASDLMEDGSSDLKIANQ